MRDTGINHPCDGVVPQVLLKERAVLLALLRISQDAVEGMAASNASRFDTTRKTTKSAGPRLKPCMRGLAPAISSTFTTPWAVSNSA